MWIVEFPAQASASCQSTQAHFFWRDTQRKGVQNIKFFWYKLKQAPVHLSVMWIVAFPAQASASCQSTPAHYLWREYINPVVQNIELFW